MDIQRTPPWSENSISIRDGITSGVPGSDRGPHLVALDREAAHAPHDQPLPEHQRPDGLDDLTVKAVGLLTEALERTERARGHLYTFHQLTGEGDFKVGDAVDALREAGQPGDRRSDREGTRRPQRAPRPMDVPDRRGLRRHLLVPVPRDGAGGARTTHRRPAAPARGRAQGGPTYPRPPRPHRTPAGVTKGRQFH